MARLKDHVYLLVALALAVPFLVIGLSWGLPTRATDALLFGDKAPWSGGQILLLAGRYDAETPKGADVDQSPAFDRTIPNELNLTDVDRARILIRYRLYTYQPDEMINLRAFAHMKPAEGKLDPGLYQYGGVWFYGSAIVLKLAQIAGLIELRSDLAYYLDHPEALGKVYLTLRLVSVAWALLATAAVYVLVRQMALYPIAPPPSAGGESPALHPSIVRARRQAGWVAAICALAFAAMPGIVVFAREAKPHVAGLALALWSAVFAVQYLRSRRVVDLGVCSLLAGLSFGAVVLYALAVLIPLGVVIGGAMLRRLTAGQAVVGVVVATALFFVAYGVTNPYVVRHLFLDPQRLTGQLGNSAAMYVPGSLTTGIQTAFVLLMSLSPALLMVFPAAGLMMTERKAPALAYALGPICAVLLVVFVVLAGSGPVGTSLGVGKPGEFARFALLLGAGGVLLAGYTAYRFSRQTAVPLAVLLFHVLMSAPEIASYARDAGSDTSRIEAGRLIAATETDGPLVSATGKPVTLILRDEPAPYNTPPLDLWKNRLVLSARGGASDDVAGLLLRQPPHSDGYWRLSWADRGFSWDRLGPPGR